MALTPIRMLIIGGAIVIAVQSAGDEKPVARVGKRVITRREISCKYATYDLNTVAHEQNRELSNVCREWEQNRLDVLVTEALHAAAEQKLAIVVTDEEIARDLAAHGNDDAKCRRLSERYCSLARAAAHVHQGENVDVVYEREVLPLKIIPKDEFLQFLKLVGSTSAAERFIETHTAEYFKKQILADAERRIARDKLMRRLSSTETRGGASASTFWTDLIAEIGVEIFDAEYRLIALEDLTWQPDHASVP